MKGCVCGNADPELFMPFPVRRGRSVVDTVRCMKCSRFEVVG